jgi:hypothetical protein
LGFATTGTFTAPNFFLLYVRKLIEDLERYRELLRAAPDPAEVERIKRLINELYRDRVWLHQNPER